MTVTAEEVLADPVGLIVGLVSNVEKHLDSDCIRGIVCTLVRTQAGRRNLAQALHNDPTLLRTGRPPAPFRVAELLMALREAGAQDIALPRCGECGRPRPYVGSRAGGRWGCAPCFDKHAVCAGCHQERRVVSRDRHGQPRCAKCPDNEGDPIKELAELVTRIDPVLDADAVLTALARATLRPAGQRRLAWAVINRPDLLTGSGCEAPAPAALRFINELVAAGATEIVKPACPRCHGVKALSKLLDGNRICRACFARHAAVPCSRCGAFREPATRDPDGQPLCPNCLIRDPINPEVCVGCGRRQPVAVRLADGVRCQNCRPKEVRECGICGRTAPCEISRATGQPWCERCQQRWVTCSGCGSAAQARSGTRDAPLCAKCTNPDPDFWGRCPTCMKTWQLSPRPCQRCVLDQKVRSLLDNGTGDVRSELASFHEALTSAERPDVALAWIAPRTSAACWNR